MPSPTCHPSEAFFLLLQRAGLVDWACSGMAKSTPESCYAKQSEASACKGSPSVYVAQLLLQAQGLPPYMGAATSLVQEISATPSRGYKFHQLQTQARRTPGEHPWAQTEERLSSRCNSRDMVQLKPALKWKRKVGAICPDWVLCEAIVEVA